MPRKSPPPPTLPQLLTAGEEEHLHRQLGSDCEGLRGFAFETVD